MDSNTHWIAKGIAQQLGLNNKEITKKIVDEVIFKKAELYAKSEGLGNVVYNLDEASAVLLIYDLYVNFKNTLDSDFDAHLGKKGAIRMAALLIAYDYLVGIDVEEDPAFEIIYNCLENAYNGASLEDISERIHFMLSKSKYVTELEWNKLLVDLYDMHVRITNDLVAEVFEFSKPNSKGDNERYIKFLDNNLG